MAHKVLAPQAWGPGFRSMEPTRLKAKSVSVIPVQGKRGQAGPCSSPFPRSKVGSLRKTSNHDLWPPCFCALIHANPHRHRQTLTRNKIIIISKTNQKQQRCSLRMVAFSERVVLNLCFVHWRLRKGHSVQKPGMSLLFPLTTCVTLGESHNLSGPQWHLEENQGE